MNNLEKLLVRHGLEMKDRDSLSHQGKLLSCTLDELNSDNPSNDLSEEAFIAALQSSSRQVKGMGMESLVDPRRNDLPLVNIDVYMRGIVRWLNEQGIYTLMSCDGHDRRPASIHFIKPLTMNEMELLKLCTPAPLRLRFRGKQAVFHYRKGDRHLLLDVAERLYQVSKQPESITDIEAENFKSRLIELLNISGSSGNERNIRQFLRRKLERNTDYTYTDRAHNLLAYRYYGDGPTLLLSAHMDTVEEFADGRTFIEKGTILQSSKGILGADDRAGIAVILELLERVERTNFNGTIKVAFTTREEIGCVGSQNIDPYFLQDVDGAMVVDRRGNRDIVTSYADLIPFCSQEYGEKFEQAGQIAGMPDWQMTVGGLSDAKSFAEFGIPSVNLSAGYQHEHTDEEIVDYRASYETMKLMETVLHEGLLSKENPEKVKLGDV